MTTADTVIRNGKVLTFDGDGAPAQAVALAGDRILAVGSDSDIAALCAPHTQEIDAQGGTVMPGLIESHIHLFAGAAELDLLHLGGVRSRDLFMDRARAYARDRAAAPVLQAVGGEYGLLGGAPITRQVLDQIAPDRPFIITAADHHTVWANTVALERAGLLGGGDAGVGSTIVMAADGTASGELLEPGAYGPVLALTALGGRDLLGMTTGADPMPAATPDQRAADKAALRRGLAHLAQNGITTFHNMDGNFYQLELLSEIAAEGGLICRGQVPMHFKNFDPLDRLEEAAEMRRRFQDDWLWSGRVKLFHDGVAESGTAAMLRPYPGQPGNTGAPLFDPDMLEAICIRADAMGLQISIHAIGDAAVRGTLDAYAAARRVNGLRDSRHRIEHIEMIHPDDLARLAALGVMGSMQPLHAPQGGFFPEMPDGQILHDDQKPLAYAWQSIRDAGVPLAFSSDWPAVPVEPGLTLRAACAPKRLGGAWVHQPQDLLDVLESYTAQGAYAEFNEDKKGRLRAGMLADVVVMEQDLQALAPADLVQARARVTLCGGRITHDGR